MKAKHQRILLIAIAGVIASMATAAASAPAGRYVFGGDASFQTVYDKKTNLTWERAATPPGPDVFVHCSDLVRDQNDLRWRVPTVKELLTLVDYPDDNFPSALIDQAAFPNTPPVAFMSSTLAVGNAPNRCVDFGSGLIVFCVDPNLNALRCVR